MQHLRQWERKKPRATEAAQGKARAHRLREGTGATHHARGDIHGSGRLRWRSTGLRLGGGQMRRNRVQRAATRVWRLAILDLGERRQRHTAGFSQALQLCGCALPYSFND